MGRETKLKMTRRKRHSPSQSVCESRVVPTRLLKRAQIWRLRSMRLR